MQQVLPGGEMITVIHFTYETMVHRPNNPDEGPPVMGWRIACTPNRTEFGQTLYQDVCMRSDDPRAVTCPACKRTQLFKDARQRYK